MNDPERRRTVPSQSQVCFHTWAFSTSLPLPANFWRGALVDAVERDLFFAIEDNPPRLIPQDYASDKEILDELDQDEPVWAGNPIPIRRSLMSTKRAHFYLELVVSEKSSPPVTRPHDGRS
jgi:hypothetical protein